MIATAPTRYIKTEFDAAHTGRAADAPDLGYFRRRYPLTVANFGTLPRREEWLRKIWDEDAHWREASEIRGGIRSAQEVIVRAAPPARLTAEGEFDIIYTGGAAALLHATLMACRYERRVLVCGGASPTRDWNLSEAELRAFECAGLFTSEELEGALINRYRAGFVKFHDAASRIKAGPLWLNGVLDVSIDAAKLLRLAAAKIRARVGCAVADNSRFVRAYVEPHGVAIEIEDERGARRLFNARLLVDGAGADSAVSRQLNGGQSFTHLCPAVGTVARGFVRGREPETVDFAAGELMISTEDARDGRQLFWRGFGAAPARDEYATHLFFYDAADSLADKSLLSLFERYFEALPSYKRAGAQWRVQRPLFGCVPVFQEHGRTARRKFADERVLVIGDASSASGLAACAGFGLSARQLRGMARLTNLALEADMTDAASLAEMGEDGARGAGAAGLAEFLRPTPHGAPAAANETLNALMAALHHLDERVRREFFQDRLSFGALRSLIGQTIRLYPRILTRVREHFGARGSLWWAVNVAGAAFRERRDGAVDNSAAMLDDEDTAR